MSYEDALNTILPSRGTRSAHITGHYGENRGTHGPHGGSDFNYQGGQSGVNLTHPVIHSPVSGEVISAGGRYGMVTIRDAEGNDHQLLHTQTQSVAPGQGVSVISHNWFDHHGSTALQIVPFFLLVFAASLHIVSSAKELGQPHASEMVETQVKPDLRISFVRCIKRAAAAVQTRNNCIDSERAHQDKVLNSNYKELMHMLSPQEQAALRDDQKKWITERDRVCALVAPPGADPVQLSDAKYCVMYRTALQARELKLIAAIEKTGK